MYIYMSASVYIDVHTGVDGGRAAYVYIRVYIRVWQYIAVTWFFGTYSDLCRMIYI